MYRCCLTNIGILMINLRRSDNCLRFIMTLSNGNIFRVTGPLCGEFTAPGEFPAQRPVTRSFNVFFDLRLNKRLSKQPWGWWFEMPLWSLWRHCNVYNGNSHTCKDCFYIEKRAQYLTTTKHAAQTTCIMLGTLLDLEELKYIPVQASGD